MTTPTDALTRCAVHQRSGRLFSWKAEAAVPGAVTVTALIRPAPHAEPEPRTVEGETWAGAMVALAWLLDGLTEEGAAA